jgi:phosphatidylserine decarboxylase
VPGPLRRPVYGAASRLLGMDLSEARDPVGSFRSLDALFVRHLRAGARTWPSDRGVVGSPVDGVVGAFGRVEAGALLQAKGREYTVGELLDDEEQASRFEGGTYVTLYLAPRHYHRIHSPVDGTLGWARHVPGRLLPVNRPAVSRVARLFPRNERLMAVIEPEAGASEVGAPEALRGDAGVLGPGAVAVVAVGAFNVGRITADFDEGLVTNRWRARAETHAYDPPLAVERGEGLMAFHLGSTVVLLLERPVALAPELVDGAEVRLGAALTV